MSAPVPDELAPSVVGGKVTDVAHVRRMLPHATKDHDLKGLITVDSFGAVGDNATDNTAALRLALAWAAESPHERPVILTGGVYRFSDTLIIPPFVSVLGRSQRSQLYFNHSGQDVDALVLGNVTSASYIQLKGFALGGPATCGRYGIYLPYMTAKLDIDIELYGGFLAGMYQSDATPAATGTLWSRIRLSNIAWANFSRPFDYFVNRSFFNVNDLQVDAFVIPGTAVVLDCNYADGNYCKIRGSAEGCGQGLDVTGGTGVTIDNWYEEANASRSVFDGVRKLTVRNSNVYAEALDCPDAVIDNLGNGQIERSGTTTVYSFGEGIIETTLAARPNTASIEQTPNYFNAYGGLISAPGYGVSDPPVLMSYDFERVIAGAPVNTAYFAGWTYAYLGTQCGVGCTDITRTEAAPHCALFETALGGEGFWQTFGQICGIPLETSMIGTPLCLRFKAKRKSGAAVLQSFLVDAAHLDGGVAAGNGSVPCANGWELHTLSRRVTADMVANRPLIAFLSTSPWYISEVQVSLGTVCPREFRPATRQYGLATAAIEGRRVVEYVDAVPTGANDPIYNTARQAGDRAMLNVPVEQTASGGQHYVTTGWTYTGSVWTPLQYLTGLTP